MRILQLLNWKLTSIEKIIPNIKEQGFDAIQLNPLQGMKPNDSFEWWLSYQPTNFKIGNCYGDNYDLINLCQKSEKYGINVYVDVVCNHVANKKDDETAVNEMVDESIRSHSEYFKKKIDTSHQTKRFCAVRKLIGLHSLNLSNENIRKIVLTYLEELSNCGVKGFRFDAAKHIGLPHDGITFFRYVRKFLHEKDLYAYGEFLGGDLKWRDEFTEYMDILSSNNDRTSNEDKHVTFIESHNTYLHKDFSNTTYYLNKNDILEKYLWLTENYLKTMFYVRPIRYPYDPNKDMENFSFNDSNELDYFDDSFLTSKIIKEANEKQKIKIK